MPHFSTFGNNYKRRFEGTDLFEQIFQEILMQCMKNDLVSTDEIFVDATHVKAAASRKKSKKILVAKKNARFYDDMLREEWYRSSDCSNNCPDARRPRAYQVFVHENVKNAENKLIKVQKTL